MADISAGAFHRRNFTPVAFEVLTVDSTVGGIALTPATYGTARYATVSVEDAEIRFTVDGTPPTSTVGSKVKPPAEIELESPEDIAGFRAIRRGAVDATMQVHYKELKLS